MCIIYIRTYVAVSAMSGCHRHCHSIQCMAVDTIRHTDRSFHLAQVVLSQKCPGCQETGSHRYTMCMYVCMYVCMHVHACVHLYKKSCTPVTRLCILVMSL